MDALVAEHLRIDVIERADPRCVVLAWKGRSGAQRPGVVLKPFFERVLVDAAARKASVELDFRALSHFNSSTVTALIDLIHSARARRVPLVLRYDRAASWQQVSFRALQVFRQDDGLLEIEADAPDPV